MKTLLVTLVCNLLTVAAYAKELTIEQRKEFADFYRTQVDLLQIYPNKPEVKVIFVDIDGDNLQEALATSYEAFYETGWLWSIYRKVGGKWEPIKGYDPESKTVNAGSGIYARPGEIFRVVHSDGTKQFLALNLNFDKLASSGLGLINKVSFWVDSEGVLRQDKIENLERYLAYQGVHKDKLIQEMQVLKVEVFDVPKKEEPNKAVEPTR